MGFTYNFAGIIHFTQQLVKKKPVL